MNIKIYINTFALCIFTLIISEVSTSHMLTTETYQSADQNQSFLQYIEQFIANFFYQKKDFSSSEETIPTKEEDTNTTTQVEEIKSISIPKIIEPETKILFPLPRNEALEIIRSITAKVFDLNDPYHISVHLEDLKTLTENLDPIIDKKTITAIHFLVENQHRTSYFDAVFWIKNMKEKELDTSIPVTEQIFKMSKADKLKILQTKFAIKKPEEEEEA